MIKAGHQGMDKEKSAPKEVDVMVNTRKGLLDVINCLPLSVAVIDQERRVVLANHAVYQYVGKNEEELIGRVGGEAFGCVHHDDVPQGCGFGPDCIKCKLRQTLVDSLKHQQAHQLVETEMVFKHLGKRFLRISTQPLALRKNQVVLLAIEDVTEAKKHEKISLEKEKLSAVLQTTGAVCHEMNQPLMTILGFSELLMEGAKTGKMDPSSLKEIITQVERLGNITAKLMSITQYKTKGYLDREILDIEASSSV